MYPAELFQLNKSASLAACYATSFDWQLHYSEVFRPCKHTDGPHSTTLLGRLLSSSLPSSSIQFRYAYYNTGNQGVTVVRQYCPCSNQYWNFAIHVNVVYVSCVPCAHPESHF